MEIAAHLPPGALVASDRRVALEHFRQPTLAASRYLSDLGSLDDFRRWGVRYFVVTNEDYGNILNAPPTPRNREAQARSQAFYGELFAAGKLLWTRPRGRVPYICPDLSVYQLP